VLEFVDYPVASPKPAWPRREAPPCRRGAAHPAAPGHRRPHPMSEPADRGALTCAWAVSAAVPEGESEGTAAALTRITARGR